MRILNIHHVDGPNEYYANPHVIDIGDSIHWIHRCYFKVVTLFVRNLFRVRLPYLLLIRSLYLWFQGGVYLLNFVMEWAVSKPRALVAAGSAAAITLVYGQTTFCEDVYFAVGEYPAVFLRVCWALTPALLLVFSYYCFLVVQDGILRGAKGRNLNYYN
jgi:hypothetical protein